MRRTTLVTISIGAHFAIGLGLFASGIWKLERLDSDFRTAAIGMMTPALGGAGGDMDRPKQEIKKKEKREKKIAKDVQWTKRVETETPVQKVSDTGEVGDGEGSGTGSGKGPGDANGDPDGQCVLPPCGPPVVSAEVKLPDPPKPTSINPQVMAGLRISGETQIHPPRVVQNEMIGDGNTRITASIKVCIDTAGGISSVTMFGTTKYPAYDRQLVETARRWRYRPYTVNGVPMPACAAVNFVYEIK